MSSPEARAIVVDFNSRLAPSREAFRAGDMPQAVRLFADAVGGPGFFGAIGGALEKRLPDGERVRIDASHSVPAEDPRAFDAAVLAFLAKH